MNTSDKTVVIDGVTFYITYADLLPPLPEDTYTRLRENIRVFGIRDAVHLRQRADGDFEVLDGQNRLDIAAELGLGLDDIPREEHDVDDDLAEVLALSLNYHRRQLTPEQRKQIVPRLRERGKSLRAIADVLGVSQTTVQRDLDAAAEAGVTFVTPDTIKGADDKDHPAVKPATLTQRLADDILATFESAGKTILSTNALKEQMELSAEKETLLIHALNLLMADNKLRKLATDAKTRQAEGGRYELIPQPVTGDEADAIRDALFTYLGYIGESFPATEVVEYLQQETGAELATINRLINDLHRTHEVISVPVNRLGRGRWWYDQEEPSVEEYESRVLQVLSAQELPTTQASFLTRAVGVRGRFKKGHLGQAVDNLLNAGRIEIHTGSPGQPSYSIVEDTSAATPAAPSLASPAALADAARSVPEIGTEKDYKLVRDAIRHALFHNPDREYVTVQDITKRTNYNAFTAASLCADLVKRGTLIEVPKGWQPAALAGESGQGATEDKPLTVQDVRTAIIAILTYKGAKDGAALNRAVVEHLGRAPGKLWYTAFFELQEDETIALTDIDGKKVYDLVEHIEMREAEDDDPVNEPTPADDQIARLEVENEQYLKGLVREVMLEALKSKPHDEDHLREIVQQKYPGATNGHIGDVITELLAAGRIAQDEATTQYSAAADTSHDPKVLIVQYLDGRPGAHFDELWRATDPEQKGWYVRGQMERFLSELEADGAIVRRIDGIYYSSDFQVDFPNRDPNRVLAVMDGKPVTAADLAEGDDSAASRDGHSAPTKSAPAPQPATVEPLSTSVVRDFLADVFNDNSNRGLGRRETINKAIKAAPGINATNANAALDEMVERGNVVAFKNAANWTVYQLGDYAAPLIAQLSSTTASKTRLESALENLADYAEEITGAEADWHELDDDARAELDMSIYQAQLAIKAISTHLHAVKSALKTEAAAV